MRAAFTRSVGPLKTSAAAGSIAVVGAAGLVGRELLGLLEAEERPIIATGSPGRAERSIACGDRVYNVESTEPQRLGNALVVFLCTPPAVSAELAPRVAAAGAVVIDLSSAFRHTPGVPLVVPEVNGHLLDSMGRSARVRSSVPRPRGPVLWEATLRSPPCNVESARRTGSGWGPRNSSRR